MDESPLTPNCLLLDGPDWKLTGWLESAWSIRWPNKDFDSEVSLAVPPIPAVVPGAVQADLLAAGLLEPIERGLNSLHAEWVEHRDWSYARGFHLPESWRGRRILLRCLGLDYHGKVLVNDKEVGPFEGTFVPHDFDVTDQVEFDRENRLHVVFFVPPRQPGQMGSTLAVRQLRPRYSYYWDFNAPTAPIGIWDSLYLKAVDAVHFRSLRLEPSHLGGGRAKLAFQADIEAFASGSARIEVEVFSGNQLLAKTEETVSIQPTLGGVQGCLELDGVEPWWPHELGTPNRYTVRTRLIFDGREVDRDEREAGFVQIRLQKNPGAAEDALPYTLVVNGEPIQIKAANWVALSNYYGAVSSSCYRGALEQHRALGANLIRVWGGGILEKEEFYNICDELGLMVLQEFPQTNGGTDGIPPVDPGYLRDLCKVAEIFIRRRAWHPCHVGWTAGNELRSRKDNLSPIEPDDANIAALHRICAAGDGGKWFLPSTPCGPVKCPGPGDFGTGRCQATHGPWFYEGAEDHYKYLNADDSLLRLEIGAEGMPDHDSLLYAAGREPMWPPDDKSRIWYHHGSIWTMRLEKLTGLCGPWTDPQELPQLSACSQFIQAEALRYNVESSLRRWPHCSGIGVWMVSEPFLCMYNSSLVDGLGHLKAAFSAVQRAFRPHHVSLRYDRLFHPVGSEFCGRVFLHALRGGMSGTLSAKIFDAHGRMLHSRDFPVPTAGPDIMDLGDLVWNVPSLPHGVFLVRLEMAGPAGPIRNDYHFSTDSVHPFAPWRCLPRSVLEVGRKEENEMRIRNCGDILVPQARVFHRHHGWAMASHGNHVTLLPGEEAVITWTARRLEDRTRPDTACDALRVHCDGLNAGEAG